MKILIYGSLIGLSLMFTGCFEKEPCIPKIKIVEKIIYEKREIPEPSKKPKPIKFNSSIIEYNGEKYYQIPIVDGKILRSNYEQLESWADENYNILKKLKEKKDK